jgi:hypothetical protein
MSSPDQSITTAADPETPTIVNQLRKATEDGDFEAFAACFLPDGVVLDAGRTYVGRDEIVGWRKTVADGPDFTAEVSAKGPLGPGRDGYKVVEHLEGDFPGGVADLDFLFALKGDQIAALMIVQQED